MASASTTECLPFRPDPVNESLWAKWVADEALRIAGAAAGEGSTPAVITLTLMAQIAYEEGDADRIANLLLELMQSSVTPLPIESLVIAFPLMAHMHASRGDLARGVQQQVEGEIPGEDRGSARAGTILRELLRTRMGAGLWQSFIDGAPGVRKPILDIYQNRCGGDEELRPLLRVMVGRLDQRDPVASQYCGAVQPPEKILTPRETHVLRLIGGGLSNKRIARDLKITPETVKSHAKHIFAKLGTRTRAESVTRAVKLCLL